MPEEVFVSASPRSRRGTDATPLEAAIAALDAARDARPATPIVFTGVDPSATTALLRAVEREAEARGGVVLAAATGEPLDLGRVATRAATMLAHRADVFDDLVQSLSEELVDREQFLVLAVDGVHARDRAELLQLVDAVHRSAATGAPIAFFGAGRPECRALLHEVRAYADRWSYLPVPQPDRQTP